MSSVFLTVFAAASLVVQAPNASPARTDSSAIGPRAEAERVGIVAIHSLATQADVVGSLNSPAAGTLGAGDTVRVRRRAVRLSEAYEFRRKVHKAASFAMIPLFVAEYAAGEQLMKKGTDGAGWAGDYHGFGAGVIATLFGINTVTGGLNWWETRGQTEGRAWRTAHSLLMLAADAGFVATGALADDGEGGPGGGGDRRKTHRAVAITSMSVATVSYIMMLKPFRRD